MNKFRFLNLALSCLPREGEPTGGAGGSTSTGPGDGTPTSNKDPAPGTGGETGNKAPGSFTDDDGGGDDTQTGGDNDGAITDGDKAADPAKPAETFDAGKLTLPEGMKSDDPGLTAFADIMKDDKLTPQERGQKLLDQYFDLGKEMHKQLTDSFAETQRQWQREVKADPKLGGANFNATKARIKGAIDNFGGDDKERAAVREALSMTGAGNNPAILRLLNNMAEKLSEGGFVSGGPGGGGPKSFAEVMYGSSGNPGGEARQ